MPKLEGIRIRNYRVLHDISLGSIARGKRPLTQLTAVVGDHGTGKSTLLDALAFLSACLKDGLEASCDAHGALWKIALAGASRCDRIRCARTLTRRTLWNWQIAKSSPLPSWAI